MLTSTTPDIAFAIGKLSRYTNHHCQNRGHAKTRISKYLKGTVKCGLSYSEYFMVIRGYTYASWI